MPCQTSKTELYHRRLTGIWTRLRGTFVKACFFGQLCTFTSSQEIRKKILRKLFTLFLTLSFVSSFVVPSEYVSWILLLMSRSFYLLDLRWMYSVFVTFPVTFYLFKDNNKINRKRLEIYSKLTKTCSHLFLLFQLLTFSREMFFSLRYTKKWIFPLRFSSVHVTKSTVSSGFGHIYWRSP